MSLLYEIRGLVRRYGRVTALDLPALGVDELRIYSGQVLTLVGYNGSGKLPEGAGKNIVGKSRTCDTGRINIMCRNSLVKHENGSTSRCCCADLRLCEGCIGCCYQSFAQGKPLLCLRSSYCCNFVCYKGCSSYPKEINEVLQMLGKFGEDFACAHK